MYDSLNDAQLMSLCLFLEARGEGLDGMLAVAQVVANRASFGGWYGNTIRDVILKPMQFSCFNEGTDSRKLADRIVDKWDYSLDTMPFMRLAYWIAKGVVEGHIDGKHLVNDATHYHVADMKVKPSWATAKSMRMIVQLNHHVFYKEG